ncbi:hypothetical protein KP509_28G070400 [Ceratopteris richardii]|uniref:Uncharacterized protein n=1 Tax=Ceratopteris richardii TaxID=49495 RepID=A0A8T2RDE3_CERRI|nr:hypothetical protein KP509_28G070400 [Ceratopteris richardii]
MTKLPLRLEGSEQWWFVAPIDWAAANGHTEVVKELLRMDPSLLHNLTSKKRMRRLEKLWDDQDAFSGAAIGRSKVVKDLLQDFHDYHHLPDNFGDNPRRFSQSKHFEHRLFQAGYGVWVLYIAAAAGDEGLFNQVIAMNPELINGDGEFSLSDLLYAAARGKNVRIFQQILSLSKRMKANQMNKISGEDRFGAEDEHFKSLTSTDYIDYVALNYNNRTTQSKALLAAARAGNVEMVRELLKDNSSHSTVLSFRDSNGTTSLHAASGRGHVEVVKLILELCPSSIYGQDGRGNTALHTAARRGCLKVVNELMQSDKDIIYTRNKNGETALHVGVVGGKQPLPKLIMKQGGQLEVVRQILACNNQRVPDYVNWKTNDGHTALHLSVMSAKIDNKLVSLLLQSPGIDVLDADKQGATALDLAQACREKFPAAEFRCNIVISLLNAAISSSVAAAAVGHASPSPGSAPISVDLADPLMCSFSHDIVITSDGGESRSSARQRFRRRSLSADWAMDFQNAIISKEETTHEIDINDEKEKESNILPDEYTLSRNLAVLRQTSIGIFETRKSLSVKTPSPMQCFSTLQSLFSSSSSRHKALPGDAHRSFISQGKKWKHFQKRVLAQNSSSPQSLRQQFSSTANVLFHPNSPMESTELRAEVASSIRVSPLASPTGSTDQPPHFSSPFHMKSWLQGTDFQNPKTGRTLSLNTWIKSKTMKKRLKQIASLAPLSFSSASETHSVHEDYNGDPYLRRRTSVRGGSTSDRHEVVVPLMEQDRLSAQSSSLSFRERSHPCFCLDNWCHDSGHGGEMQNRGQHKRIGVARAVHTSKIELPATNASADELTVKTQSNRLYRLPESSTDIDLKSISPKQSLNTSSQSSLSLKRPSHESDEALKSPVTNDRMGIPVTHACEPTSGTSPQMFSLKMRSRSSRSYTTLESLATMDHIGETTNDGHSQGLKTSDRRSGASSPITSPRLSASLSLSPWLSPSLRKARKQNEALPLTPTKKGKDRVDHKGKESSDVENPSRSMSLSPTTSPVSKADKSASSTPTDEAENPDQPKDPDENPEPTNGTDASIRDTQNDSSVNYSPAVAVTAECKSMTRQNSFSFCKCASCFQHCNAEEDQSVVDDEPRRGQTVYHT